MKRLLLSLLIFAALAAPGRAQFVGYTSPQTVQQNLTSGATACTGATQSFNVQNLGQTQHTATLNAVPAPTSLKMAIFGIDTAGFSRQISDTVYPDSLTSIATVNASGYFPLVQVQVVCATGGSFTLQYVGASSTPPVNSGGFLQGSLFKQLANAAPANTTLTTTLATPNGTAAGQIAFTYAAAGPAGSTLTVSCPNSAASSIPGSPFTINTANTTQLFYVPSLPCPNATVTYTSGGASATTFTMVYDFIAPGTSVTPSGTYTHVTTTTATAAKATGGFLHTLNVNTAAAGTISIFDLATAACTGTPATNVIAVITVPAATNGLPPFVYDVNTFNGICVKASVAMDFTVSTN